MKKAWNPLNIQRLRAHEKTLTNKKPMKMPWNKMKPTMFCSWLFNHNEKATNWKAIFHGVRIYGVFMGVFKFMPHKKNNEFSVNGWILMVYGKWNGIWWHFHYPWIKLLAYFLWERQRHVWPPWKFSLKLFSTVKSNTSLRICWLVNLKLYTCSNNPNPKWKLTVFRVSA